MISIEEYRSRIRCFCTSRKNINSHKNEEYVETSDNNFCPDFACLSLFITFFYILTLKFNINMAFLKLSLLLAGDIESNPGPDYKIQKSVFGHISSRSSKIWRYFRHSMFLYSTTCYLLFYYQESISMENLGFRLYFRKRRCDFQMLKHSSAAFYE